jgi:hypothetical protein
MQEQEYEMMLKEAEASVVHMTEVVQKYQVQVKKEMRKKREIKTKKDKDIIKLNIKKHKRERK